MQVIFSDVSYGLYDDFIKAVTGFLHVSSIMKILNHNMKFYPNETDWTLTLL